MSYIFSKDKNGILLQSDSSSTVIFTKYKNKSSVNETRTVILDGESYALTIMDTKDGKMQFVKNSEGFRLATIFLSGPKQNQVTLQDGTEYQFKLIERTWVYTLNGMEVLKGEAVVEKDKTKKIVIKHLNQYSVPPELEIIALEKGIDRLKINDASTIATIVSIVVGCIAGIATQ